ncbi:MAG: hypothetical protein A2V98_03495 [Planctomycetes bacterium RBG_16_64_12]|nr:MAG: hypothetical protein A2V98_03495 [Planctomycetes bacterium RBG_16_64_12]
MSDLVIRPVATRRQKKDFLGFPWSLYRGDPHWIPPLRLDQKELVGYRPHPFYENNDVQTFLAYRSGEVCGRIAAILNRGHIEVHGERRGFFGFFECADDQAAADGLFDAVKQWFSERDIPCLRGPVNPSMNYTVGLLVDGFDSAPTFMMPYNPAYYSGLIEGYGFRKAQDLYAYWGNKEMQPAATEKLGPIIAQIQEYCGVVLRPMDTSRFREEVEAFLHLYNQSMTTTWGFVPMSAGEVQHMAKGLRYLIVPELALAADVDGKMIGAVFALPDYNPRIRQIDGRLFPFGFLRLIRKKHEIKRVRVLSANVIPEYHRMGVGLVLLNGMVPKGWEWGLEEAEFSWILESNFLSRNSLEKGGAKRIKTYRVYDFEEDRGNP